MKILLLDIETSPNLAWVWGLWKQNVAINQIEESGRILCWAAKWLDAPKMFFSSSKKDGEIVMLQKAHELVSEADCIVTYNGRKFDLPTLNREWIKNGFEPPAPHRDIDLLEAAKRRFRFTSNKLDYVTDYLGLGQKVRHGGFELWTGCMEGNPKAWREMERYNKQDVKLLESLYKRMLPWLDRHPSHGPVVGDMCCPKCGSEDLQMRGWAYTQAHKYQRYQCKGCGGWLRGHKTVLRTRGERPVSVAS